MNNNIETTEKENKKSSRSKILWSLLFIGIAVLTIWAVTQQNQSFSFEKFGHFLKKLDYGYIIAAFAAMIGFIVFEAMGIRTISASFGHKRSFLKNCSYSSADIYFSAITPSATGGQPACAYFMIQDGIPGSMVTVILVVNLIMYTFAIVFIGILGFILRPSIFLNFSTFSKILIVFGCVIQVAIATFFIMLLKYDQILYKIGNLFLTILYKVKLIRKIDAKREWLSRSIQTYRGYVQEIKDKKWMLVKAFFYNLLQRICLIAVTVFSFLATGGSLGMIIDIIVMQSMVVLGSNSIPIPGAMGVVDYLMLDAFEEIMNPNLSVNLELLSRSISFYFCVVICGLMFLIRCLLLQFKKRKNKI